jgi:hypothetical protein
MLDAQKIGRYWDRFPFLTVHIRVPDFACAAAVI